MFHALFLMKLLLFLLLLLAGFLHKQRRKSTPAQKVCQIIAFQVYFHLIILSEFFKTGIKRGFSCFCDDLHFDPRIRLPMLFLHFRNSWGVKSPVGTRWFLECDTLAHDDGSWSEYLGYQHNPDWEIPLYLCPLITVFMGEKFPKNPEREHNKYHAQTGERWTNMNQCPECLIS